MYKNNKILKAAAGAPLVLGGIPAAAAAPELIASMGPLALFGGLTALAIYNATHPHTSQTYMQDLQAQMAAEELANFELYKSKLAKNYQEKLENGEYVTTTGTHITSYNPETMELSGYRIGDNGDIGYITKNVYTGEFSPSVYYDANTGAYYEGINIPYANTVEISKGENLMPWSMIPATTPVGLTFDNTIMAAPLEGLYVAKKKKSKSNSGQAAAGSESISAVVPIPPPPPPPEDEDKDKNRKSKTVSKQEYMEEYPENFDGWRNWFNRWRLRNTDRVNFDPKTGRINFNNSQSLNTGSPKTSSSSGTFWKVTTGMGSVGTGMYVYDLLNNNNNNSNQKLDGDAIYNDIAEDAVNNTNNNTNRNTNNTITSDSLWTRDMFE